MLKDAHGRYYEGRDRRNFPACFNEPVGQRKWLRINYIYWCFTMYPNDKRNRNTVAAGLRDDIITNTHLSAAVLGRMSETKLGWLQHEFNSKLTNKTRTCLDMNVWKVMDFSNGHGTVKKLFSHACVFCSQQSGDFTVVPLCLDGIVFKLICFTYECATLHQECCAFWWSLY